MIPQSIEAALVILLLPGRTWRFCARTVLIFVIPRTKQIESRILDFPLPLRPVIELKLSSLLADQHHSQCFAGSPAMYHPEITVRTAYDLKPWTTVSSYSRGRRVFTHVDDDLYNPHLDGDCGL